MKHSIIWIALCSIAVSDVCANRLQSTDSNNVQSPISSEHDNGKQGGLRPENGQKLHQRLPSSIEPVPTPKPASIAPKMPQQAPEPIYDRVQTGSSVTDALLYASESEGKLAMDFMAETYKLTAGSDFVLGPFGIWGITTMIFSAADKKTSSQLSKLLRTDKPSSRIVSAYKAAYTEAANRQTESVESTVYNLGANIAQERLPKSVLKHFKSAFNAEWFLIDAANKKQSADQINHMVSEATNGRINGIITESDFDGLKVLLASATFFKGRWQQPFNLTATASDVFKNEDDNVAQTGVPMMRMRGIFKYAFSTKLQCQVLELPHADGMTSMIVLLPQRKGRIQTVLDKMRDASLAENLPPEMPEEEVDVSLPRFSTEFRVNLNQIFVNLKARRMFDPDAELPGISNNTFISRISHAAEIEVSEEGTTASSVTSALVSYKQTVNSFQANRPFIYFINHVPSRLILYSGVVFNPKNTANAN